MKLRCPSCREAFPWAANTDFPRFCPLCRDDIGHDREDDDIVMPFVRSNGRTKAHDDVYRQMETASEHRMHAAAEQAGVPVSEMSGLKLTDLKSAPKQGDIAAPVVTIDFKKEYGATFNPGFGQQNGAEYGGMVQSGPEPSAGARMRTALQQSHGRLTGGVAVSDRPAVETTQPGYRRRG